MRATFALLSTVAALAIAPASAAGQGNPNPQIGSLNPDSYAAGAGTFDLTVRGANFREGAVVRWNGNGRPTQRVSDSELQVRIYAGDVAQAGTGRITVAQQVGQQLRVSSEFDFPVNAAASSPVAPAAPPAVSGLIPSQKNAESGAFDLYVSGSGFANGASVRWNGADRPTTYESPTRLKAAIPASDLASPGTAQITVSNPAPGGAISAARSFEIGNPNPVMTSLSPDRSISGTSALTLTINGSGFVRGALVRWEGNDRPTTFVSATRLTAAIPASDLSTPGNARVAVFNPPPGGGGTLSPGRLIFIIRPPAPTISSVIPGTAIRGGPDFTLTVNGSNYMSPGSSVRWNGAVRPTQFVSSSQLKGTIPASDIATLGDARVSVVTDVATNAGRMIETSGSTTVPVLEQVAGTLTSTLTTLAITAFRVGGSANPERVLASQRVPLYLTRSGTTPTQWRASTNRDFSGATWRAISETPTYTFPLSLLGDKPGVEVTTYFQYRHSSGSSITDSDVASDAVVVRKPLTTSGPLPDVWGEPSTTISVFGKTTSSRYRLICPSNQVMTGVRIRQGLWIDAIGLVCAGANQAMLGNTSAGTLLSGTTCSGTNVPGPYNLTNLGEFLRFNSLTCDSNLFGKNTYDPLYARLMGGGHTTEWAGCVTRPSPVHPEAGSAPIGLDVYINAVTVPLTNVRQTGVAGLTFICARPD